MKTAFTAALYAALIDGSPFAYGTNPMSPESSPSGTSYRSSATVEIHQFGQAWALPVHQVVAVLVFLRSWLHNHLVMRNQSSSALSVGDAEVLLAYARWLDGFPQVVRALPDRVLLEEAAIVKLKVPKFLPAALAPFASPAGPEMPDRSSVGVGAGSPSLRGGTEAAPQGAGRAPDRRFEFVKSPALDFAQNGRIGRPAAKASDTGFSDLR